MKVLVNVKKLGKRISTVEPTEFELCGEPENVRELICAAVKTCVESYNRRLERGESGEPLTEDDYSAMERAGKMAFGLPFSDKKANVQEACETALQAFEDGLYRVFLGENELEELDEKIMLEENSELTFIRLAMLAGRIW